MVSSTGDFFLATVVSLLRHQLVSSLCRAHIDIEDIDLRSSASPSAEGAPLFSYRQVFLVLSYRAPRSDLLRTWTVRADILEIFQTESRDGRRTSSL